jgi:hypothetical protein
LSAITPIADKGIDSIMAEAVALKVLEKLLTKDQLSELIQIPPPDT